MADGAAVASWTEEGGRLLRVRLDRPPGNVLDREMLRDIQAILRSRVSDDVAALVLDHEGPHFSYGSSVEEHLPGAIEEALPLFHETFRTLASCAVPTACAIDGLCLGGGLELACACDVIFVGRDVELGQPEIRLGVFAPVGSAVLRERVGEGRARELLLTGRTVGAGEAMESGLAQGEGDDPSALAVEWVREHLLSWSSACLRRAARAARASFLSRVLPLLDEMERLYLEDLMGLADAREGLSAFLEKREPRWTHRG